MNRICIKYVLFGETVESDELIICFNKYAVDNRVTKPEIGLEAPGVTPSNIEVSSRRVATTITSELLLSITSTGLLLVSLKLEKIEF